MGYEICDRELEILFLKVDTDCDGFVDWVPKCLFEKFNICHYMYSKVSLKIMPKILYLLLTWLYRQLL